MLSGELLRSCHIILIGEYRLIIDPQVVGHGQQVFAEGMPCARLELTESEVAKTGGIMATYRNAVQRWNSTHDAEFLRRAAPAGSQVEPQR